MRLRVVRNLYTQYRGAFLDILRHTATGSESLLSGHRHGLHQAHHHHVRFTVAFRAEVFNLTNAPPLNAPNALANGNQVEFLNSTVGLGVAPEVASEAPLVRCV